MGVYNVPPNIELDMMKATGKRSAVQSYEKLHREFLQATKETVTMGWTCPQCGVNYSPNVVRCPCTEKRNQEPPKKSVLDGWLTANGGITVNKELGLSVENKEHS